MRVFLRVLVAIVLLFSGGAGVLYLIKPKATVKEFGSYNEAITGDELKDHWMPDLLPKSATDIYVAYEVDSGFFMIQFSYHIDDEKKISRGFEELRDAKDVKAALGDLGDMTWRNPVPDSAVVFVPDRVSYKQSEQKAYLAIDPITRMAWYSVQ